MTCSPSRLTTTVLPDQTPIAPLLRFLLAALVAALVMAMGLTGATPVHAAESSLSVAVTEVDVQNYPRALVTVQVGGSEGAVEEVLPTEAFQVSVDGEALKNASVRAQAAEPLPTTTVLLIDESGSMKGAAAAAAAAAAQRFIAAMRPEDRIAVHSFNEEHRVLHTLSGDPAALTASLDDLEPSLETALYDSVLAALETLETTPSGSLRYLLLLSDGGDTASKATLQEVKDRIETAGVQIYAVGLKTTEFDSAPLQDLALSSGGRYLETPDPAALTALYSGLAKELHNHYVLDLQLPEEIKANNQGVLGAISVTVTSGDNAATGEAEFLYPDSAIPAEEPLATSQADAATDGSGEAAAEPSGGEDRTLFGLITLPSGGLLAWNGFDYLVSFIAFLLVFTALYLLSGVLFPRRNVLEDYSDILENRRRLGPKPREEVDTPGPLERVTAKVMAVRGYEDPLQRWLEDAGWALRTSEFVLVHVAITIAAIIVTQLVGASLLLTGVVASLVVVGPLVYLNHKATQRRSDFESQVPDTLVLLANSLRSGQGFEQAMRVAADEGPEPTAQEFRRILAQQRLGVSPEEALRSLADRMQSEAFDWVVMATIIQRQVGGNLAEVYESIAYTLRERDKLRNEVKTLTAEGRISAIVLILLPIAVATLITIINPEYEALLYTTRPGLFMVGGGVVLILAGIVWLRSIIRFDI